MPWKGSRPFIASVALPIDSNHVDLLFNRDVDPITAQNTANYVFDNDLEVIAAVRDASDDRLIHLTTGTHFEHTLYTLTVNGIADEAGKEVVAWPNNRRQFFGSRSWPEIIVDNESGSPAFSLVGDWATGAYGNPYGTNYNWAYGGSGDRTATWRPELPADGIYDVFAYWVQGTNRATNSPFIVHHLDGADTVRVNQEINGEQWYQLGSYPFEAGTGSDVTLTNDADQIVIADAVRWKLRELLQPDAPPAAITDLQSTKSEADIVLAWSAVTADTLGNPETILEYIVYRHTDPTAEPADSIGSTSGTSYLDAGAAGSSAINCYYVVRAVDQAKGKSQASNLVGEFDVELENARNTLSHKGIRILH
jgi:hypothetical protein